MSLGITIKANTFLEQWSLRIYTGGVHYLKSAFIGGIRHFAFSQIESVLLSDRGELSFQVGNEVFSIPVKLRNPNHKMAIDWLAYGARMGFLNI